MKILFILPCNSYYKLSITILQSRNKYRISCYQWMMIFFHLIFSNFNAQTLEKALKFENLILRVEKYRNSLVAEGESVSPVTKMSKIFLMLILLLITVKRKSVGILVQKFTHLGD